MKSYLTSMHSHCIDWTLAAFIGNDPVLHNIPHNSKWTLRAYAKNRHRSWSGTRNDPAITLADYIFGLVRYQAAIQLILFIFF